ncbi:FAD-dependent monooxygenase [Streptomyces violaceusniger]|uniref:FAD-binding monooxygenase n=1 Tax=Streptomyces violaceusniger (strain Tu 4113) TaxID=653045 RepID=G2P507_STRV4|nr:FAD-dependent monooxygenase [Streptomyces violaceusniger]AEM84184.1 FAD-binding monooxygenase [Streptomyces violaceusniger Tu 4113]
MLPKEVSVLIVGGGGSGLSSSIFLSDLGVDSLLVERRPATSHMPKAGAHNQRTMEIFRRHGIAEQIQAIGAPAEARIRASWMTSLGGDDELDRKHLFSIDVNGEGIYRDIFEKDSPELSAGLGQYLLEPLLQRNAEERNPGGVRFGFELISLAQEGDWAIAEVRERESEQVHTVRARYVIAADGGRAVGPMFDVTMVGQTGLATMTSLYFRADLSAYVNDDVMVHWFVGPRFGSWAGGCLVKAGPKNWDSHSETWTIHLMIPPDDPDAQNLTNERALARLREVLNLPDLDAEILGVSPWHIESVHIEKSRIGNIFFIGDAAHRQPPTSGLGLQSAIQDADNLAWKLAAVLKGWADPSILDTYETERRPVIQDNIEYALFAFQNQFAFEAGMGLTHARTPEERRTVLLKYLEDSPMGRTRRAVGHEVFNTGRMELDPHDREIGFHYEEGVVLPDGTAAPSRDPMGVIYTPTTRPGHRLPHAWLNDRGKRLSTHDIGGIGTFILLTGPDGAAWCEAAERLSASSGVPIEAYRIAPGGDFGDPARSWSALSEIEADGALLVRPDRYIACRFQSGPADPYATLESALAKLLNPSPQQRTDDAAQVGVPVDVEQLRPHNDIPALRQ